MWKDVCRKAKSFSESLEVVPACFIVEIAKPQLRNLCCILLDMNMEDDIRRKQGSFLCNMTFMIHCIC